MTTKTDISLDLGLQRSFRWRTLRRRLIVFVAALCFLEYKGLPHVRWTMTNSNGIHRHVTYWSLTGPSQGRGAQYQSNDPLFLLLPMKRPPSSYAVEVLKYAKASLQKRTA